VVAERHGTSLPSYQMYPFRSAIDIVASPLSNSGEIAKQHFSGKWLP
jgi:hypothetical protein